MSLLDLAAQAFGGANPQAGGNAAITEVMNLVNSYPGGVGGIVGAFEKNGLGGVASSWVSTGANQPISPQQVQSGLGSEALEGVAAKLGVSPEVASGVLAQLLPHVINHVTPDGQVPPANANILESCEGLLKGFLK